MGRERQSNNCQHNYKSGVAQHHRLSRYLLRAVLVVSVATIVTLGVADNGGDHTIYAAPDAQSPSSTRTLAIVGATGAPLYASPGGEVSVNLIPGTVMTAVGRSGDNLWVVVQSDSDLYGWMEVNDGVIFGLEQLQVIEVGDQPVTAATIAETSQATPSAETSQPLPTALPVSSPVPNALPTPLSTAPPAPTGADTPVEGVELFLIAVVKGENAGLYDQPNGTLIERLSVGLALTARGRSADGQWLMVIEASGVEGWAQIEDIIISNVAVLPILDPASGLPVTSDSENTGAVATTAQPAPTPEAGVETPAPEVPSVQVDTTLSADPNETVARVSLTDARLNIRIGPGLDFSVIGQANPGDTFKVLGRNTAATWVNIDTPGIGDGANWVSADFVAVSWPILGLIDTEAVDIGAGSPVAPTPVPLLSLTALPVPTSPAPTSPVAVGDIRCTTNQIAKWDDAQALWVCSDELAALQAAVAILQAEVASLRVEISELKK